MKLKLKKLYMLIKQFGLVFSIKYSFYKFSKNDEKYIKLVKVYLKKVSQELINKYNSKDKYNNKLVIGSKTPVWVCWFQGEDNMPELCKICYEQLKRMIPENAELNLITLDNYREYVQFPDYIIEKVEKGIISYTHFSDILRWALLEKHGGFWIDSTVFCSKKIEPEFLLEPSFWSVKLSEVYDLTCIGQVISQCKWSGFILKDRENSLLVKFVLEATLAYWEKHDFLIDYFIENLFIKIACENIGDINNSVKRINENNISIYDLHPIMDEKFDEEKYNNIINNTTFFKLTWKQEYRKVTKDGYETFYGYLARIGGIK